MTLTQYSGSTMGKTLAMALATLWLSGCDTQTTEQLTERSLQGNEQLNLANQMEAAFQLDGDATDDANSPGIDWWSIHNGNSNMADTKVFLADPAPLSTFSGGGSKDTADVSSWRYKNGSVPDKDNITNAYAAAYTNPGGELIVYFGADRFANEGEALLGFWFFQKNVKLGANGKFAGTHTNGDLLILANFSKGGSVADIKALEWMNGKLTELDSTNAACNSGQATLQCAIANTASVDSPWPYFSKISNVDGPFPPGAFFEGGVNISALFEQQGEAIPCFASFLAETRASTAVSATLKDFALGSFPVCGLGITAGCKSSTVDGNQTGYIHGFQGTVTNSGAGTIYGIEITVSDGNGNELVIAGPASLAAGQAYNYSGEFKSSDSEITISASVAASTANGVPADLSADTTPALGHTCKAVVHHPGISVENDCNATLKDTDSDGRLEYVVEYTRKVCNTTVTPLGEEPIAMDIVVTDISNEGAPEVLGQFQLKSPECEYLNADYFPSESAERSFASTIKATGSTALFGQAEAQTPTSCDLCP